MKNVMARIVEDFKVLSEEFQVLADDFDVLLKLKEMYDEQGGKCSSQKKSEYKSAESGQMGHTEVNNNENNGHDVETGQGIDVENEKGRGDSSNYAAAATNDGCPSEKAFEGFVAEKGAEGSQGVKGVEGCQAVNTIENKDKEITIETVRSILSQKTRLGKVKEVKEIIKKYGADKLTALNPSCYKELLKEAENI